MGSIEKNFFPVNRSLQNHWLWQDKPFSKGQAWIDLLMMANYEEVKTLHKGEIIIYKVGEVNRSKLYLADRWGWDRKKVDRFLAVLEADKMVTVKTTTHGTTITVENYSKYNNLRSTNRATDRATTSQRMGQPVRTSKKEKKEKKEKKSVCRHTHGKFLNVFLSDAEYEEFYGKFENADEVIERLSNYKKRKLKNDDNEADLAWLESFALTDGKPKAARKSKYEQYLAEAKLGYPPPDNAGLTEEEFEKLKRIAEENE